jgi:hypothetical protein
MSSPLEKIDPKIFRDLQFSLTDLLAGDDSILSRPEYQTLSAKNIMMALDYLTHNPNIPDKERAELTANSWRVNYRSKPPTPENFITQKYLGPAAASTYDRIKNEFVNFMDPRKPYRNLILYPHIGWGKSYLSMLINIYVGTHLSMMRNPYKFFGLNPASVLTQLLISYSLKKSSELLLEPLIAVLETSPFFEKVHTREAMIKKDRDYERQSNVDKIYWTTAVPTSAIQFSNGANFKLASSAHSLLGLTVVTGTMSELAFFRDAGKSDEYIMRVFNDLKGRVDTRMKGNYWGRTILDSSPNTLDSPIDDYVVNSAHKDPINYIVDGSCWKWAPEDYDLSKTFKVFVGGKGQLPKIMDNEEEALQHPTEKVIEVPLELRQFFSDDIYKALKDRAGIPSGSADSLIYDYSKIEAIFDCRLRNIYTHIQASENDRPEQLIWNQVVGQLFRKRAGRIEFWYKPHIPRCVAIDQSLAHDVTCISAVHVERLPGTDDAMYVVDFTIPIAPMGDRINLDAIKLFVKDLRDLGGMDISHVSYDNFQSAPSIQFLNAAGFETEKLSVDLTLEPYLNFMSLINTHRVTVGRNIYVKNNIKSLRIVKGGTGKNKRKTSKVDHDDSRPVVTTGNAAWETSPIGGYSKDCTDAIVAAIELNRMYHPIAYDAWAPEELDSLATGAAEKKRAEEQLSSFMGKLGLV